jgi:LuxR family maltose regulon positive regulatory protein
MSRQADAYMARFNLFTGQKQAAEQWAAGYLADRGADPVENEDLTLARVLLATNELDRLPSILHPILEKANATGTMQTGIETMLLLSLYHQANNDPQNAREWLGKALELAAPEGYARIFLDEGKPLLNLLPKVRASAPELVDALLQMSQPESAPRNAPKEHLPDALSEQELRVLNLIVAGMSNQEIADELVISVGTAKWHVHNVLQKLGAKNRSQAIARARELES